MSTIAVTVHLPIVIIKKTATLSVVISHHRRTRLHQLGRLLLPHILFTVKLPTFLSNQPPSAVCAQPPFTRPTYFPVHLPSSSPFLPPSPLPRHGFPELVRDILLQTFDYKYHLFTSPTPSFSFSLSYTSIHPRPRAIYTSPRLRTKRRKQVRNN